MIMTLSEAKSAIQYYKEAHPNHYKEIGGEKITEEKIISALEVVDAIAGGFGDMSEDEIFKRELTRLCNES